MISRRNLLAAAACVTVTLPASGKGTLPPTKSKGTRADRSVGTARVPASYGDALRNRATGLFTASTISITGSGSYTALAIVDAGIVRDVHLRKGSTYQRRGALRGRALQLSAAKYQQLAAFGVDANLTNPTRRSQFLAIVNGTEPSGGSSNPAPCPADFFRMNPAQQARAIATDPRYSNCRLTDLETEPATRFGSIGKDLLEIRNELFGIKPAHAADWTLLYMTYDGSSAATSFEIWYEPGIDMAGITIGGFTATWFVTPGG